jgi:membrane-associated phospholipid phosphatase
MSTHAHEYGQSTQLASSSILADQPGFPSSHSTNSVSIALYFAQWLLEERESVGSTTVIAGITCKSLACALEDIS